mgnify:CR=1 FL=1
MASPEALEQLLQDARIWRAGSGPARAPHSLPTGWPELDGLLGGGWPAGQLIELLVEDHGSGELSLLLPALVRLAAGEAATGRHPRPIALVAPPHVPYAPALAAAGLDPASLLVVRTRREADTLWALEQLLHSHACIAVLGWMDGAGSGPSLRRLQLAAAQGRAWVVLYRDARLRNAPSPAPLRIHLERHDGRQARLHVLKRRGGPPAEATADLG